MFSEVFVGKQMDLICWEDSCGDINRYTDDYGSRNDAFNAACCPRWPEHVNCKIVYMEWILKKKNPLILKNLFEEKRTFHLKTDNSTLKGGKRRLQFTPRCAQLAPVALMLFKNKYYYMQKLQSHAAVQRNHHNLLHLRLGKHCACCCQSMF